MGRLIGIDLGTTNSVMACMDDGDPVIIPNERGGRMTPSVVAFGDNVLVGETARNQAVVNADSTIIGVKRFMGTSKVFPIDQQGFSPQEVSSCILKKLKQDAEHFLGEDVREAVITVPAYFSEKQRRATREAGKMAGLEIRRIINEPTAAALMYANSIPGDSNILVYDLGGGTFDVTLMRKESASFQVLATRGDNHLGGMDFDSILMAGVLEAFQKESGLDLKSDPVIQQQLRQQVEQAKIDLSSNDRATIMLPFINSGGKPVHLNYSITRQELNKIIRPFIDRTIGLLEEALKDGGISASRVDSLILSGGSSRIPLIRELIEERLGCSIQCRINPDEAVALGAAVQAGIIENSGEEIILKEVTPHALGVEIEGGQFISILDRNTQIPSTGRRVFTTVSDNQSSVEIHVMQGISSWARENFSLGRFLLSGIRKGIQGEPRIEVFFHIDMDGLLHVKARDMDTRVEQKVNLTVESQDTGSTSANAELQNLRYRLSALIHRVEALRKSRQGLYDRDLEWEIRELLRVSRQAVEKGDIEELWEKQLSLETLIGELLSYDEEGENASAG